MFAKRILKNKRPKSTKQCGTRILSPSFLLQFLSISAFIEVAGIFKGDVIGRQMHIDFKPYDFEYLPIETLSVVYQQFLHSEGTGKQKGAYYTPIHLVKYFTPLT